MDAYIGEIRLFAGSYAPEGWLFCNGATVSLDEYQILFSLIGTTYGGDGRTTFGLPDLGCRIPVGVGTTAAGAIALGQKGGQDDIALTEANLPSHTHPVTVSSNKASSQSPGGLTFGTLTEPQHMYIDTSKISGPPTAFSPKVVGLAGQGVPFAGTLPQMGLNYIICAQAGLYPEFP